MVKSYSRILDELYKSLRHGNIVSIKVKGVEKNILTSVQDLKANSIVILNAVSVYGTIIEESVIHIEDIESMKVYHARYGDPVYVRIRELKNNIDQIRRNMRW